MQRVFITGGTGLVGSHVAQRLRRHGVEVVVLARAGSDTRFLEGIGASIVRGDILDPEARLAAAIAGADALVHAAAIVYQRGTAADAYARVNADGCERVLRAAAAAGCRRVLHVSSIAVYSGAPAGVRLDEDDWQRYSIPHHAAYPLSKQEAEWRAWRLHDAAAIRLTVVRPGVIFGERDRLVTAPLLRLAGLPMVPLPRAGKAVPPVVYAGNIARGIVRALRTDATIGRAYTLASDWELTLRQLLRRLGACLGRPPRIVGVPALGVRALAALIDAAGGFVRGPRPQARRAARTVLFDHAYDQSRARADLNWSRAALEPPELALPRVAAEAHERRRASRQSRLLGRESVR
ncbi:MAG: NAD-dependent epimerase/dehydratase family protein [Longimicrobiales bacterium]